MRLCGGYTGNMFLMFLKHHRWRNHPWTSAGPVDWPVTGKGAGIHNRARTYTQEKAGLGPAVLAGVLSCPQACPTKADLPHTYPKTVALVQQCGVGVQEGAAAIVILGHRNCAQVDEIKAVAPLSLPDNHAPAPKPEKRPRPVGLEAAGSLACAVRSAALWCSSL